MYATQLRMKPEFKHLKAPSYTPNHYSKMQTHQLENLKRDLELKKAKAQSTAMRQKILEYRDKINYQNELDRIRGYLSSYDTRFPIGTVKRLRDREAALKKLGAEIVN
jgi:hypothetical protein